MATIRQRGDKWQAIIRHKSLKGKTPSKTFAKKALAVRWAKEQEALIEKKEFVDDRPAKAILMSELFDRYLAEITPTKAATTAKNEEYILDALVNYVGNKSIAECDEHFWYEFGIHRRTVDEVSADTLIKDLQKVNSTFTVAKTIWQVPIVQNPVPSARNMLNLMNYLKDADLQRNRRVSPEELKKIEEYKPKRFSLVKQGALFSIETGMRRSEVTEMVWSRVDFENRIYDLEKQKSDNKRKLVGRGREVPLSPKAIEILKEIWEFKQEGLAEYDDFVWPWRDPHSFTTAFRRMCERLKITGLRLHDNRHEFGSKETDKDVDMRKVAAAMGHSDLRSMSRYTHPDMKKYAEEMD